MFEMSIAPADLIPRLRALIETGLAGLDDDARADLRADLSGVLDRVLATPVADCPICHGEQVTAVAAAIRVLGGTVTRAEAARIDAVIERAERSWTPFDPSAFPRPAARPSRPGRNAPCPCGSGRKYKNCHLDADRCASPQSRD